MLLSGTLSRQSAAFHCLHKQVNSRFAKSMALLFPSTMT